MARSPTPAIMILGTGSNVGKSLIVAGLARAFTLLGEPRELRLRCQPGEGGSLNGLLQVCGEEGKVHASLGFRADGHLLLEPGRLLDDPPGLLLRLMLGCLWQDQGSEPPR